MYNRLMIELPLDRGVNGGTYKLIGGKRCLDFVNTISWPGTVREHEWLHTTPNTRTWLASVGLPTAASASTDFDAIIELRATVTDVLRSLAHGHVLGTRPFAQFNEALRDAQAHRTIDRRTLQWTWPKPAATRDAFLPLVIDTAEYLVGDHSRLKYCAACDWLFDDQSRNGSRRWCDMADCGSRDKAKRYYHRSKGG
jgi:predicted RNA-binding Zn ribbon-like protein